MSRLSESPPLETSMTSNVSINRQFLEPSGSSKINEFLNFNKKQGTSCPEIKYIGPSKLLSQVKSFLPELKASESSLKARLEAGEDVDIENISEDNPHIEMNFQINEMENTKSSTSESSESDSSSPSTPRKNTELWTSDSDPDSPQSPEERNNSWTSDSDIDSSSSCSCSSDRDSSDCRPSRKLNNKKVQENSRSVLENSISCQNNEKNIVNCDIDLVVRKNEQLKRKKPLIEDITPSEFSNIDEQSNVVNESTNKRVKHDDR